MIKLIDVMDPLICKELNFQSNEIGPLVTEDQEKQNKAQSDFFSGKVNNFNVSGKKLNNFTFLVFSVGDLVLLIVFLITTHQNLLNLPPFADEKFKIVHSIISINRSTVIKVRIVFVCILSNKTIRVISNLQIDLVSCSDRSLYSIYRSSMTMTFQGMIWFRIDNFNAVTLNDLALHHRGTKGIAKG